MHLATYAALACLALAIRPLLYGITPLLPQMQSELDETYSAISLLVTVPVFAVGMASLAAPAVAIRLGVARTATVALAIMLAAGVARALLPDLDGILLASVPLGIGAGICGVLLPMIVKSVVPARSVAAATSVYTVGMQLGGAVTASIAVPLAAAAGGWRPAFLVVAGLSTLAVAGWLALGRRSAGGDAREAADDPTAAADPDSATERPNLPAIAVSKARWLIPTVIIFGLLVLLFHGLNSWLPALYLEHGWSATSAGALLAALVFAQVPGTLVAGYLADKGGQRRTYLIVPGVALAIAIVLLVSVPDLALAWAVLAGAALGAIAPITLVIALDFGASGADVGRSTAVIFGVGYVIASVGPFVIGLLRDASGSFAIGLGALALVALLISAVAVVMPARPALPVAAGLS